MHIDFDNPKTFIPDGLIILLQSAWMFEIDELFHLFITIGTFTFLIVRIIYFIRDRKEKKLLEKSENKQEITK